MVEPWETRLKSKEVKEKKFAPEFNKKKNSKKCNKARWSRCSGATQGSGAFRGQEWARSVPKDDAKIAVVHINKIQEQRSLKQDKLTIFTPPELDENTTPTQKEMWRILAINTIKYVELLESILEAMYEVVLSICDPTLKDQVCNHEEYEQIVNRQDTVGLQRVVMMAMSFNGDDDTHMWYNHVVAITDCYGVQ